MRKLYYAFLGNLHIPIRLIINLSIGLFLLVGLSSKALSQSISVTSVTTTPVCAGSEVTITFDVINGTGAANYFNSGTNYQVFLSDASGGNFQPLGSTFNITNVTYNGIDGGATSGLTTTFTIPASTVAGNNYKIAIGSTSPDVNGALGAGASPAFTVNAQVTPSVTIDISPTISLCEGATITLTAMPVNGGSNPTYQWRKNGVNIPGATGVSYSATVSAADDGAVYRVRITSNAPCATPLSVLSPATTLTVIPLPTVNSTTPGTVCGSGSVTLQATASAGATIDWYDSPTGGTLLLSGSNTYAPNISSTTTYYAEARTTTGGCISSSRTAVTATVNPNPTADAGGALAAICQGATSAAMGGSVGGGATGGTWSGGTGTWTNANNPATATYTAGASESGNITLTLTTTGGSCGTVQVTKNIIVNPNPTANAGGALSAICQGATSAAMGGSVGGGATGGTWSGGAGTWTNANNPATATYTASASESGTITLTLTTNGGSCGTVLVTKNITVNPNPTASAGGALAAICQGATSAAMGGSVGGGATGGTWSGGAGTWTNANNPATATYTAGASESGTIMLTLTTSGGSCGTVQVTKNIIVNSNPTANAGGALAAICQGATSAAMGGSVGGGATGGTWSGGAGTWTNANNPATATYTAGASESGTITLTLTTSGGSCGMVAVTKTIVVNPTLVPAVTLSASSTSICSSAGTSVTFTATPTNGGSSPIYTFKNGATTLQTGATNTYTTTSLPAGANITVTMTSNATCASPATVTSNAIAMTVYTGAPAKPGNITTSAPSSICPVATGYTFSVTAVANATSYVWNFPDAGWIITSGAGTNSIVVTVSGSAANGNNLPVTVQAQNACGLSPASNAVTFRVNKFAAVDAGADQSVCAGSSVSLQGTLLGNAGTGTWSIVSPAGSGNFSNVNTANASATFTPTISSGQITLLLTPNTPGGDCTGGVSTDQMIITVNQPSVAPTNLSASPATICNGNSTTLTQTGGSLGTGASWKWYSNNTYTTLVGTGTGANASLSVSPTTTTTYYLRAESSTGAPCAANVAGPAAGITVTVNQPSIAPASLSASVSTICNGSSTTLTQAGGSLGTGASWKWYSDAGFTTLAGTSAVANASLSVSPITTTTYYLRAESATGAPCAANVAAAGSVTVTVNQPSVAPASLSASVSNICNGSSTTLTQTGGSLGTGASWKWYSNNTYTTLVGTGTGANASLSVSPGTTTTYYLRAESSTGAPCAANVAGPAAGITVTVNQPSVAPASLSASVSTICNGSSTTLTQTGGSLGTGASWKWYSDAGFTTLVGTSAVANASLSVSPVATTTYYLRAESATGAPCVANVAAAGSVTVTVNQPSIAPSSLSASTSPICNGSSTTLTQTGGSLGTGATWKWYTNSSYSAGSYIGDGSGANAILSVSPVITTTYYVRAESATGAPCAANVAGPAAGITVTVNQPPSITADPTDKTVCASFPASFSVSAMGTGLTYQWYFNGNPVSNGGTISGATSATLSFSQASTANQGNYYVVVTGSSPCGFVTSATAVLTVNESIIINTQPLSQTVCENSSVTFSVSATGDISDYEWRRNGIPLSDGANISGSGTATLTLSNVNIGGTYDVVISGTDNSCSQAISLPATLTINTAPSITAQPAAPAATCSGSGTQTITVGASGTGLTYSWRKGGVAVTNGGVISGQGTNTLTLTNPITGDAGSYDVVISGTCSPGVTSNAVTVTINTAPSITAQPAAPAATCSGSGIQTITVGATGTGLTYSWRKGGVAVTNGGVISGQGTNTLTLTNPTTANAGSYDVVISGTCSPGVTSTAVTVVINTAPSITAQPAAPAATCSGSGTQTITVGATGTGLSYSWRKGGVAVTNGGVISGQGTNTLTLTNPTTGDAGSYDVVISGTCSPGVTSNAVTVTINTAPSITAQPAAPAATCSGSGIQTITVGATGTGLTYSWRKGGVAVTNGGVISGQGTNTLTLTNPTTANAGSYDVVISGTCSPGVTSAAVMVDVSAAPVGGSFSPSLVAVCSGASPSLTLTGYTGTITKWQQSVNAGNTWTDIITTVNPYIASNITQTTLFRAVVTNGVCSAVNSSPVQVVIDAPFTPTVIAVTSPTCIGTPVTLTASGYTSSGVVISGGDFSQANPPGWNGSSGVANNESNNGNWGESNNATVYNGQTYSSTTFKYMIATGLTGNASHVTDLTSPIFSLVGLSSAYLALNQAYNLAAGASGQIQISTDGGSTFTTLQTYIGSGSAPGTIYGPTNGLHATDYFSLNSYLGLSNLQIRFRYTGTAGSDWAMDNIFITNTNDGSNPTGTNVYNNVTYTWTAVAPASTAYLSPTTGQSVTFSSTASGAGSFTYNVTTTTSAAGCTGAAPGSVTVVVNPKAVISAMTASACSGTAFSVIPANGTNGTVPAGTTYSWSAPAVTGGITGGASGTNATSITGTLINTSGSDQTATYTVTPLSGTCTGLPFTVTVTVKSATVITGQPAGATYCQGAMATPLSTAAIGSGALTYQWYSNTTNSNTGGIQIAGQTSSTYTPGTTSVGTFYYYVTVTGGCGAPVTSNVATVVIGGNSWTGAVSADWNNSSNWCSGVVPNINTDVIIPVVLNLPKLVNADGVVRNLTIAAGANVDLNGHTLEIAGTFSGSATGYLKGSDASGLIIDGSAGNAGTLYFDPANNYLKTLTLNSGSSATLGNNLNITAGTGGTFGSTSGTLIANGTLNTNDMLTIKSDVNGDAVVGNSSGTINGNVTVERYFPKIRAWRFVTAPVGSMQTIKQAWQEGVNNDDLIYANNKNPNPGFGTHITYNNNPADGYDVNVTTNPSIRYWNPVINNYDPLLAGTQTTLLNAYPGYYLFVRGSRDIDLSLGVSAGTDPTVLRAKGVLAENSAYPNHQSGNAVTVTSSGTVAPGQYFMVGNPFASPVNLANIINSTTSGYIPNEFYVWDPKIAGDFNVGGYVTYSNNVWAPVGGSYPGSYGNLPIIQSGQAFLMKLDPTHSNASLEFHQEDKYSSETQVFGFGKQQQNQPTVFYTNLLTSSGGLLDGVAGAFTGDNAADAAKKSASKKWNSTASIGLYRNNAWSAIEFRPTPVLTDTLFYYLNAIGAQTYTLQIITQDVPAGFPQAWLVDKLLNTKTAVVPGTPLLYSFSATGDINTFRNRFMLVFKRSLIATPIPVTRIANQANPGTTGNANSIAGQKGNVSVHPNPVPIGEKVTLQFTGMTEGRYQVTVTNALGKAVTERTILHDGGSNTYSLQTGAGWAAGSYFVKITNENGYSHVTKLVISK